MIEAPFCELCSRKTELFASPSYLWWRCPKWPDQGEHWWSDSLKDSRHSLFCIPDDADLTPKRFDKATGKPL